jgi:aminoglycoside phosphotransferase family enzyme/predicted kinase
MPRGLVDALGEAAAHPNDASASAGIERIQTHISHLFLSAERVYKLRKPVTLPFLDFKDRAARNADCVAELQLNRRLAPDVYLGLAPIRRTDAGWAVGVPAEQIADDRLEHCVVMRRLPSGRDAQRLVQADSLTPEHVASLALRMAEFHEQTNLGCPAPYSEHEWQERIAAPVANTIALARASGCADLDPQRLDAAEQDFQHQLSELRERFEARRAEGRAVDGHGDLHLDHVWFEEGRAEPLIIDCIEFDAELRRIDVAAELAFFTMDVTYRGRPDLAELLLRQYAAHTGDYALYGVVDFHTQARALVRAAVAAVAAGEEEIDPAQREAAGVSAARHLELLRSLQLTPKRPGLLLTTGLVGSGKSTVAEAAAEILPGVVVSSDRVRKQRAGLRPEERASAAPGEGIYDEDTTRAVYAALLDCAAPIVESGRVAVLDATYYSAEQRDAARRWAAERSVPVRLIEVRCNEQETLRRLASRERDPSRISDAGPDFLAQSDQRNEPPDEWPEDDHVVVFTDRPDWRDSLSAGLLSWPTQHSRRSPTCRPLDEPPTDHS